MEKGKKPKKRARSLYDPVLSDWVAEVAMTYPRGTENEKEENVSK